MSETVAVADGVRVVVVEVDGTTSYAVLLPDGSGSLLTALQTLVRGTVDAVEFDTDLDMWVNRGMCRESVNPLASQIGQAFGAVQPFFGPAVFTGGLNEDGDTLGLSVEWVSRLLKVAGVWGMGLLANSPTDPLSVASLLQLGRSDAPRPGAQ